MIEKEIAIYASFYCNNLSEIEINLRKVLINDCFKRIEQGTVLIYEDGTNEFSVESYKNSFYLTGRMKNTLENGFPLIEKLANIFKEDGVKFSIDYQEENANGDLTSLEFNISNKMDSTS